MRYLTFALMMAAGAGQADTIVAARMIRAQTILMPEDLSLRSTQQDGPFSDPADLIGQETRVALYPGRAVQSGDVGPPAIVDRNQIVRLIYDSGGLMIVTEGRSLARAGEGDLIRVMNLGSRATVSGLVRADGSILVSR
jgi:flagella basal body P-ring formation protein FlgA